MKFAAKETWLFTLGRVTYSTLEVLWRGYTHWTMALCGGLCLCLITSVVKRSSGVSMIVSVIACGIGITLIEFLFGCFFNLLLGWQIWDYSDRFGNLLGQICPAYFFLWCLLSLPLVVLIRAVRSFQERSSASKASRTWFANSEER